MSETSEEVWVVLLWTHWPERTRLPIAEGEQSCICSRKPFPISSPTSVSNQIRLLPPANPCTIECASPGNFLFSLHLSFQLENKTIAGKCMYLYYAHPYSLPGFPKPRAVDRYQRVCGLLGPEPPNRGWAEHSKRRVVCISSHSPSLTFQPEHLLSQQQQHWILTGVPTLLLNCACEGSRRPSPYESLMPDDLILRCGELHNHIIIYHNSNSRNKMHNQWNALESSWDHPSLPQLCGKNIFHETGPCAKMVGDHCRIAPKTGPYVQ